MDHDKSYDSMICTFRILVEKHAHLKSKIRRGDSASFITPELERTIYTKPRCKKEYDRNPTHENKTKFKKQRKECGVLRRKAIKN